MRIAIGSDHRGVAARLRLIGLLERLGHEVVDCGSHGTEAVDYPDMAIAANKVHGVRAATCHDLVTAEMSRRHNDLNVLCLSAEMLGQELQDKMIQTWLETPFEGGRHARRLAKIEALEPDCGERQGDSLVE